MVSAEQITKLDYPSLKALAVTDDYAKQHRKVMQPVVCQVMRAQTFATGSKADTYISNAARLLLMDEPFRRWTRSPEWSCGLLLRNDKTPRACHDTRDILSTPASRKTKG